MVAWLPMRSGEARAVKVGEGRKCFCVKEYMLTDN